MLSPTVAARSSPRSGGFGRHDALVVRWIGWHRRLRSISLGSLVLNYVLTILLIPIALPTMACIALAILVDSGKPVFFVQERIGRGGRIFRMFKFRTLRKDHVDTKDREHMQAYVRGKGAGEGDSVRVAIHKPFEASQITRLGSILRKTSLDELPQLFNVLRGEMSLVGPRPNVPWEVQAYHFWQTERLDALPGITGLAQVRGRSGIPFDQLTRYDIEYIRNKSLWLDLKILWWTVDTVLQGYGAG